MKDSFTGRDEENKCTMNKTSRFPAWRPDKILYKGEFEVVATQIAGNSPLIEYPKGVEISTPSDHMCVITDFKISRGQT